jgi:hypothetical protein
MPQGADENFISSEPTANPTAKDGSSAEPTASGPGSTSLVRNATGPRTQAGKCRSKYNSTTHGILSKVLILHGESRAGFNALLNGLRDDFHPEGTFEEIWVERLATLLWRERRLIIAEGQLDIRNNKVNFEEPTLGLTRPLELDVLIRYDTTLNRNIERTLNQLERHQRMRLGQPVPPPINLNITASKE